MEDEGEQFPQIRVSEATTPARSRTRRRGQTRLNLPAIAVLTEVGKKHQVESLFPWIQVREGKQDGSLYVLPTKEADEDRLHLNWGAAGQEVWFSLNKVLKAKGTSIPKGHTMVMDCFLADLTGWGAALELRFGKRRLEETATRKGSTGGEPA